MTYYERVYYGDMEDEYDYEPVIEPLVSVVMNLSELSASEGAVFKYDNDGVSPVRIPREAWEEYGRPTEVRVRISVDAA